MSPTLGRRRFHLPPRSFARLSQIRDPRSHLYAILHSLNLAEHGAARIVGRCGLQTTEHVSHLAGFSRSDCPRDAANFAIVSQFAAAMYISRCACRGFPSALSSGLIALAHVPRFTRVAKIAAKSHLSGASTPNRPNHCQTDLAAGRSGPGLTAPPADRWPTS